MIAHAQGLLTCSEHDINILIDEDFAALSALLGSQKYFFGNEPCATDACVFGFLQIPVYSGDDTSYTHKSVKQHANLVHYVDRIREEYFADKLAKLSSKGLGKAQ